MNKRDFRSNWMLVKGTAGPSTSLRSGRDDKFIFDTYILHNEPSRVHFSLNLPQASQLLGMTKGKGALPWSGVAGLKAFFISSGGGQTTEAACPSIP